MAITYKEETRKQRLNRLWSQLDYERSNYISLWQSISDNISPRRAIINGNDPNKSGRRNGNVIDITATLAERTLMSGMMAGITSPAREWFRLTTQDPEMAEHSEVKDWLAIVTDRMNTVLSRSNFYNQLPMLYGDGGTFGTGAMLCEEDFETVVRFRTYEVGTYYLANDAKGEPNVFMRQFQMTVRQVVEEFAEKDVNGKPTALDNFSKRVQNLYREGQLEQWVGVVHAIYPNQNYDGKGLSSKTKKFSSCYYEGQGTPGQVNNDSLAGIMNFQTEEDIFLRESGYDIFPVLVFRWGVRSQDAYGTTCPGMVVLGLVSALQLMHKRKAQAIEQKVRPTMNAAISMKQSVNTTIAGGVNWIPDELMGKDAFKRTYEIDFDTRELSEYMAEMAAAIKEAYFVNLFNSVLSDFRSQPRTAEEMRQLLEEKLSMIGPTLEQAELFLSKLIDLVFDKMKNQFLVPEPPQDLQGEALRVEYVSILAQAQKALGIGSLERFLANIGQMAQFEPSVLDNIDFDATARRMGEMAGVYHNVLRDENDVIAVRQSRAQQQAAQQAAAQLKDSAETTKTLADTKLDQGSALDRMVEQARAGQLVNTG